MSYTLFDALENDILAGSGCVVQTLETVKETASIVTLLVTFSIFEAIPARNRSRAVYPRLLPVERAVSTIPLTLMDVTLVITNSVPRLPLTVWKWAGWCAVYVQFVLTESSREEHGATAAVLVWVWGVFDASTSILAWPWTRLYIFTA